MPKLLNLASFWKREAFGQTRGPFLRMIYSKNKNKYEISWNIEKKYNLEMAIAILIKIKTNCYLLRKKLIWSLKLSNNEKFQLLPVPEHPEQIIFTR